MSLPPGRAGPGADADAELRGAAGAGPPARCSSAGRGGLAARRQAGRWRCEPAKEQPPAIKRSVASRQRLKCRRCGCRTRAGATGCASTKAEFFFFFFSHYFLLSLSLFFFYFFFKSISSSSSSLFLFFSFPSPYPRLTEPLGHSAGSINVWPQQKLAPHRVPRYYSQSIHHAPCQLTKPRHRAASPSPPSPTLVPLKSSRFPCEE